MSKRAFPFSSCSPLQLKTHVESKHVNNTEESRQKVYAKTQSMLREGAKMQCQKVKENNVQGSNSCQNCKKAGDSKQLTKCSFCEKNVCVYCCHVCFKCEQNFCHLCSVLSYEDPMEKSYCLSCSGS